jgi:hypothetical protein
MVSMVSMFKRSILSFSLSNRRDSLKASNRITLNPQKPKSENIFQSNAARFPKQHYFLGGSQACPFVFPVTAVSG